ncbi:polysaccharide deacetylase family protein [Rhodopirellula sp. JC639]|uniref:polysaccharide deacetylase family protein n=1 Tax=Stieleria mannarensis TaxID=2755585 RepID=UPI0016046F45|nr:polysaccharide deacetylase family protein [Rhodopirellula sp. JC639]
MFHLSNTIRRTISVGLLALITIRCAGQEIGSDQRMQIVTIQFQDQASADRAEIKIEPLFDGHYRAVSCRWDDNWTSDNVKTREMMKEYGIRGTFYLNDREFSPENRPADYLPVAKQLLEGGNSIGGHSLTHPFVTYFHSHRMFQEMSGVRIAWESMLDRPVTSYAYSFVDIRPGPEDKAVTLRTLDSLERAGFYHLSEYVSFFNDIDLQHELSPIMPPENQTLETFQNAIQWAYNDESLTEHYPMISNSMHAWYGTQRSEYGYDELRKRFDLLVGLEDVWHCNQNQYGSYRRQYREAKLTQVRRSGNTIRVAVTRPSVLAVNDDTPLTLSINGVGSKTVLSVDCNDATVVMSDRQLEDRCLFHLGHPKDDQLPTKIGHIANPDNHPNESKLEPDPDFPQINGVLHAQNQSLKLSLKCAGDHRLDRLRVAWRVPIGYQVSAPIQHAQRNDLQSLSLSQELQLSPQPDQRWGQEHFAAQVDFLLDGQPGRIHLTCQRPGKTPDESLPKDGFAILGPIPNDQFDVERLVTLAQQQPSAESWEVSAGSPFPWRPRARDGYVNHDWLNPEYVRTMGTWDASSQGYVLRSTVHSPQKRQAAVMTSHPGVRTILVNGQKVGADHRVELQKGDNKIVIIYPGCTLGVGTQRLTACFVRLSDVKTGKRLRDIRYEAY